MADSFEELIEASGLEFEPVTERELADAENQLGTILPPSLRHFLLRHGAGTHGEVFDPVQIVAWAERLRTERGFPEHLLPIFEQEDEYFCCLDVSKRRRDGECPVYCIDLAYETSDGKLPQDYEAFRDSESFADYITTYLEQAAQQ